MKKKTILNLYFDNTAVIRDEESEVDIIDTDGNTTTISTGDIFDIHANLIRKND